MEKVRKSGGARKVVIIIAIVLLSLILILLAASMVVMDKVFKQNFGTRIDTGFNNMYFIEDFEGLTADRREFKNNRGDTLVVCLPCGGSRFSEGSHNFIARLRRRRSGRIYGYVRCVCQSRLPCFRL